MTPLRRRNVPGGRCRAIPAPRTSPTALGRSRARARRRRAPSPSRIPWPASSAPRPGARHGRSRWAPSSDDLRLAGEFEHALGDDVALDLVRAGTDRPRPGPDEVEHPCTGDPTLVERLLDGPMSGKTLKVDGEV